MFAVIPRLQNQNSNKKRAPKRAPSRRLEHAHKSRERRERRREREKERERRRVLSLPTRKQEKQKGFWVAAATDLRGLGIQKRK